MPDSTSTAPTLTGGIIAGSFGVVSVLAVRWDDLDYGYRLPNSGSVADAGQRVQT